MMNEAVFLTVLLVYRANEIKDQISACQVPLDLYNAHPLTRSSNC